MYLRHTGTHSCWHIISEFIKNLVYSNHLMRLKDRECFIEFIGSKCFNKYTILPVHKKYTLSNF